MPRLLRLELCLFTVTNENIYKMYEISQYSDKIRNTTTNEVFLQDEREVSYPEYRQWLSNGGTPVYVPFFEGEQEEKNQKRAIEIDFEYTDRIFFEVEIKHIGKKSRDETYVYPQSAIDEINRLRAECNQKITEETGITDYTYRKNIPKLATFNINS